MGKKKLGLAAKAESTLSAINFKGVSKGKPDTVAELKRPRQSPNPNQEEHPCAALSE